MRTVYWDDGAVKLIDQTRLPHETVILSYTDYHDVARAIADMQVRGAPAIGVTAAFGVALAAHQSTAADVAALLADIDAATAVLRATRPTAVNLFWAIRRIVNAVHAAALESADVQAVRAVALAEAQRMADEDIAANRRMGAYGAVLIRDGDSVLTHCNAGALATVDYGTALGVVRAAWEQGKRIHVFVDETRPFLQGARLTAWELMQLGIPMTLITDNMAGHFMGQGKVNLVIVGADRIAANGDAANKIGTYPLSVLARAHGIPFYVVAPTSTIDPSLRSGNEIPIEERDPAEVTALRGVQIAPEGVRAAHPAFDVTPHRYIAAIVTENGICRPPFTRSLRAALRR